MKRVILSACAIAVLAIACSPKAAPAKSAATNTTVSTASSNNSNQLMPATPGDNADDIAAGEAIMTTSCARCHKAKTGYATSHTYAQALPVMNSMAKKARLTPEQAQQLAAYLYSVAKK
jgi:mono/diheme cytochrome c family protein